MLNQFDKLRGWLYVVSAVVGVLLTAATAGYEAVGVASPQWLLVAWAVYGVIAAAVNTVSRTNLTSNTPPGAG